MYACPCNRWLALHPPLRVELALVDYVMWEVLVPQRRGFLVHLGDAETVLPPPVVATILIGDKPRVSVSKPVDL